MPVRRGDDTRSRVSSRRSSINPSTRRRTSPFMAHRLPRAVRPDGSRRAQSAPFLRTSHSVNPLPRTHSAPFAVDSVTAVSLKSRMPVWFSMRMRRLPTAVARTARPDTSLTHSSAGTLGRIVLPGPWPRGLSRVGFHRATPRLMPLMFPPYARASGFIRKKALPIQEYYTRYGRANASATGNSRRSLPQKLKPRGLTSPAQLAILPVCGGVST